MSELYTKLFKFLIAAISLAGHLNLEAAKKTKAFDFKEMKKKIDHIDKKEIKLTSKTAKSQR